MSLQSRLQDLYTELARICDCYHYFAPSEAKAPYIVWAEDSEDNSFEADNHKARQAVSGYVDYFTKTEFDTTFDTIQSTLHAFEGLSWTWDATQYGDPANDDDNLIHSTWSWRLR